MLSSTSKDYSVVRRNVFLTISVLRRAKLYLYGETLLNKGSGNKSWNERGLGQMKILK